MNRLRLFSIVAVVALLAGTLVTSAGRSSAAETTRTFSETGRTVQGVFLKYWNTHGGLAQQGYPISDEMYEISDVDSKIYKVQYFERAVFEYHPEFAGTGNEVLLTLLGVPAYSAKHSGAASGQVASTNNPLKFAQTGKTVGGAFRTYWEQHGGLAQEGYPISDEFTETSATDGKTYTVQYFERGVLEYHPELAGTGNEVLLSLLGTSAYEKKHGPVIRLAPPTATPTRVGNTQPPRGAPTSTATRTAVVPTATDTPSPTATDTPTDTPLPTPEPSSFFAKPGWTSIVATTNNVVLFYNTADGTAATARMEPDGSLTLLQTFPDAQKGNGTFSYGFSTISAGPNNVLLFYHKASGGATLLKMGSDGIGIQGLTYQINRDLTNFDMDTQSGILMTYNSVNGNNDFYHLGADGVMTVLKSFVGNKKPQDPAFTSFVPVSNGIWLWYMQSTGFGATVRIGSDGSGTILKTDSYFSKTWTNVASDGRNVLFYDKATGYTGTGIIGQDNSFLLQYILHGSSTNWTYVTATRNSVFMFYDTVTGQIITERIAADGSEQALQSYEP